MNYVSVAEYIVRCPICSTEIRFLAHEANPMIIHCAGCSRNVVLQNNALYTVSEEYVRKLIRRFKSKACGKIVGARISQEAQSLITTDKIKQLHSMLEDSGDVVEFLKKLDKKNV